jgi:hypothetical protein
MHAINFICMYSIAAWLSKTNSMQYMHHVHSFCAYSILGFNSSYNRIQYSTCYLLPVQCIQYSTVRISHLSSQKLIAYVLSTSCTVHAQHLCKAYADSTARNAQHKAYADSTASNAQRSYSTVQLFSCVPPCYERIRSSMRS